MDPRNGDMLAFASSPTYDPKTFAGRPTRSAYGSSSADEVSGEQLPDAEPRDQRRLPGRLDLQARDGAGRARHDPDLLGGVLPVRLQRIIDDQKFENWDPYVNEPMTPGDRAHTLCDTYFYDVGEIFYEQQKKPPPGWARRMGFGRPTGSTSARRIRASSRRRPGASAPSRIPWTSSGRAATPCSLRSGRATFSSPRCR